LMMDDSR